MSIFSWSILLVALISQVYSVPQFITFKDGKLGVNFGGYHAGIGIGGLLDGTGTSGGLYAEAGTPHGQTARAGLGGSVNEEGEASGGLFAGASAGGNVKASAGLAGSVNNEKTAGGGFASAQAGDRVASSGLAGETSIQGSAGIITSTNDVQSHAINPTDKKVDADFNIDSINEVKPLSIIPLNNDIQIKVDVKNDVQLPAKVGEVDNEREPQATEEHVIQTEYKPHRQHFRKTAFLGGYIGADGEIIPPTKEDNEPVIQKRIDVDAEATAKAGVSVDTDGHSVQTTYTKEVTHQRNPTFFQDIFNIPISALRAVGNFLSNTAANTNVSVQKSASVEAAEKDIISAKHDPSSVSSSSAHISVETPSASKIIDDIIAIPINTLGAVNKFLDNNVAGRKSVQIRQEGEEPTRVRLGPHARRRANKQVVIVQEVAAKDPEAEA